MVVSLSSLGRDSWAVVGFVPGLGPVGAELANHDLAGALREHILTRPAPELVGWSVTDRSLRLGQDRWGTADEAAAVADLDPRRAQHQAVARNLRGVSSVVDGAIADDRRASAAELPDCGARRDRKKSMNSLRRCPVNMRPNWVCGLSHRSATVPSVALWRYATPASGSVSHSSARTKSVCSERLLARRPITAGIMLDWKVARTCGLTSATGMGCGTGISRPRRSSANWP